MTNYLIKNTDWSEVIVDTVEGVETATVWAFRVLALSMLGYLVVVNTPGSGAAEEHFDIIQAGVEGMIILLAVTPVAAFLGSLLSQHRGDLFA